MPSVQSPKDLGAMSQQELQQLAQEIRATIVETVARGGGHLGASLGTVELTIALHTVFQSPRDRIVWDTGHQTYGHKLLTGRYAVFETLRQPGGISGFCKRNESEHDVWEAGHAGTSLSAALGMAVARDLTNGTGDVIAVIGDGAMTAGMALEALNNIGQTKAHLIIVLNDNGMSISRNVGALPSYLARLRSEPTYLRFREDVRWLVERVPLIGQAMTRTVQRIKDGLKQMMLPGMLFEDLGLTYLGPVDGHNIVSVQEVLRQARQLPGPVLCHVVTVKGKGYGPTEEKPEASHARSGPFDPKTGRSLSRKASRPTYTQVFADALVAAAEGDERIVAITAAMSDGTGLNTFAERFPHRCFDVGIAEQHAVTFAAGLALSGLRPVVAVYSTFLQRAYDQIVHDVALQNLPVIFALDRAGLVGADGATHQGLYDISYLRHIPGMSILVPRDEGELPSVLATALAYTGGPVAFRYPRGEGNGVPVPERGVVLPWGKGEVLRKRGEDAAIVAIGSMCSVAMQASELLEQVGIGSTVVDARFCKPLDAELLLDLARRCRVLVTVEEHVLPGGFGSAVEELLAEHGVLVRSALCALPDAVMDQGDRAAQLEGAGLSAEGVAATVCGLLGRRWAKAVGGATQSVI